MEPGEGLWAGILNGITVVYDPAIQLLNSRWVLLYALPHKRLIAYERSHARSVTHAPSDRATRAAALNDYRAWRRTVASAVLEEAADNVRLRDARLSKKLAEVTETHRRRLQDRSIPYRGITEPDGRGPIRNPLCRGCHRAIGNDTHLICNACEWIICLNCSTCGCGG